jgi:fibronectin-binding autotransporter adhesin
MKNEIHKVQTFAMLAAGVFIAPLAQAQTILWTGADGSTAQNWSDSTNWSAGVPGPVATAIFTNNTGAATNAGTVDNIVDAGFASTIASLQFANTNNISTGTGFHHTTQIGSGQTLTVAGSLIVGDVAGLTNCQVDATFTGAGTLVITNPAAVLNVSEGDSANNSQAVLNMTNLNTFNATLGGITVGVYNTPNLSVARQKGYLDLAKTNVISVVGNTPKAYGNEGQIEVGENLGNGSNIQVPMYLGIVNTINVNSITIGGDKQGSGALLAFNPVFTNGAPTPLAVFRGTNGPSTRVSVWKVADNSNQSTSGSGCSGAVNLSGGQLDALVDMMIIGEGESGSTSGTGNGTGTFTFNAGTNNVNTLYLGYRVATGGNSEPVGTMNVNDSGTLVANDAICLSFSGGGSTNGTGTLNINGGTVLATTITNGVFGGVSVGASTSANINVNAGTLGITSLSGVVGTSTAPMFNLSLSNAVLQLQVSGFQTNVETSTLTLSGTANTVNFSYLPPVNAYPVTNALIGYQTLSGTMNVAAGSFPTASPAYQGYVTNLGNTVYLILTNGPVIGSTVDLWTGLNSGNWDFSTINWTSFGSPTTFANGAPVVFDDTATRGAVNLTTAVLPAGVTVSNNTLNYAFGGGGKISGSGGLTKLGIGTLLLTNSGANDFLGNITINAGTLQFGNGGASGNLPTAGTVLDNGNLVFDQSGNVTVPNAISGSGTITQNGSAALTLTGDSAFNGTAVVSTGTLLINGIISGSLTNASGSAVGGSGTNTGPVNVSGLIQPSAVTGAPATFTSGGTLTLSSGATLAFDLSGAFTTPGSGINDLLAVGGDLDVNNNSIALNFQGVPQAGSTYTLINYAGNLNGTFNSTMVGTHISTTLHLGVGSVSVTLNNSGGNLKWNSTTNNLWNIGGNTNWLNLGSSQPDVFYQGDTVLFDDSVAGVANNITIPTGVSVSPTAVTVNSSSVNYAINGPGGISGNVSITKQGGSTLTLASPNVNFTGTATVQAGILRVGGGAAFGNGTAVATNAGTIDLNGNGIGNTPVIVSGSGVNGNGAIINGGADQIHAVNNVKMSGDTVFGGTGRWDIRVNGLNTASLTTSDSVSHNIIKKGANEIALVTCAIDQSIGNIDIQGGTFALQLSGTSQNSTAWFNDTTHTITVESGAQLELNTLGSAFPLLRTIALMDGSTLLSDAGDNGIGGSVVLQGNDTISVTGGSSPWLLITGTISGSGNLLVNGTVPLILFGNNNYTGNTLIKAGTLTLLGNGSISSSANIIIASNAVLDVSQSAGLSLTLASGQTLQGNGTISGTLIVGPGATVSAGTNSSFTGLLTVTNGVQLQGNTFMKLNPATAASDRINAIEGSTITYGGTLTVSNVSATPFAIGNSFTLFNAAGYSGSLSSIVPATPGPGLTWNTNGLSSGVLSVVANGAPQPGITSVSLSGTTLVINGTNGVLGEHYSVLTSTNAAAPLSTWTLLSTNSFSGGTFSITNTINTSAPQRFFILRVP